MVNKTFKSILNLLYPPRCLLCGMECGEGIALCSGCQQDLPINEHCCTLCALPLESTELDTLCGQCLNNDPGYDLCYSPWLYQDAVVEMVSNLKFHADLVAGAVLGQVLAGVLMDKYANADWPEVIVPVPLHWARHWGRGFNQATEIGRGLLSELTTQLPKCPALPVLKPDLCKRIRSTPTQVRLDAKQRRKNLHQAFVASPECRGRCIALLDDVLTTGSTASAIAAALNAAGAREIHVWSVARTPRPALLK